MIARATRVVALTLVIAGAPLSAAAQTPEPSPAPQPQPPASGVLVVSTFMYFFKDAGGSPVAFLPAGARVRVLKRDGDWYDLVGGKSVVYPDHLMEIEARLLGRLGA